MRTDGQFWWNQDEVDRVVEFHEKALVHVKGPWAGRPYKLVQWQIDDVFAPLFGWRRPHSIEHVGDDVCDPLLCEYGRRRYRELNLFMPRKNTKSMICAGLLIVGVCADGEPAGMNYCMAGDLAQADELVFEMAASMAEKSRVLKKRLKVFRSTSRIVDAKTDSFVQAIPGNWEGALGPAPHFAVMDEHLVQANTKLENAITSGMGSRRQPLFVRASSAPRSIDTPTGRLITRIRDIHKGVRQPADDVLNVLYEAPEDADWRDRQVWIRANPGYGTSLQPAFVDAQIKKAIDQPTERPDILQYGLNMIPDALGAWMPLEKWDACGALIDLTKLEKRPCIVAVSMPSAVDLAAVAVIFPPRSEDEPLRVIFEFHLPSDVLAARANVEDAPPYQEWIDAGVLHIVPDSDVLSYQALEDVVLEKFGKRFEVQEVVCNPRGAMQFMQDLQEKDSNVIELVPQYKTMSPALTELRRLVGLGRGAFVHDGSLVLRWMWTKCKVRVGPNEEIRPDRERSLGNIEGVIALASALNRAIVSDEDSVGWAAS